MNVEFLWLVFGNFLYFESLKLYPNFSLSQDFLKVYGLDIFLFSNVYIKLFFLNSISVGRETLKNRL